MIDLKTLEADSGFVDKESHTLSIIKVVGVGGGGGNAVNHMYQENIEGVSFALVNTDVKALRSSPVETKLAIDTLGAGGKPELARQAAEKHTDDIANLFDDETKMVFITAGMGGGTGTGAGPMVAKIARDKGILTVGIVTIPFLFEGRPKIIKALSGAREMEKYVDALLVINNERLVEIYPDLTLVNAFAKADDTLTMAARSISELITANGYVNVDFRDVDSTLRDGGPAIISTGEGEGEKRVTKAIQNALESPLLKNRDIYGAKRILIDVFLNPKCENGMKTSEIEEITAFMRNFREDVEEITGFAYDESMGDKVRITILASGFDVDLTHDEDKDPNEDDIRKNYGASFEGDNVKRAEIQYVLLTPDQMDDDDVINLLDNNPVYRRPSDIKQKIESQHSTLPHKPIAPPITQNKKTFDTISFVG